jgi:5'-3' exonuclease
MIILIHNKISLSSHHLYMGVPGFYRTVLHRYKNKHIYKLIGSKGTEKIEYFYMDFNPIIYLALLHLQITDALVGLSTAQIEDKIICVIIESSVYIVNNLVKPTKLLYIAIDGPAPKCKIVTQRTRRYKGIYEKLVKQRIQAQYSDRIISNSTDWDKASITPGTEFMQKLDLALRNAISKGLFNCPHIVLNDSTIPSEGEHKITQHIKNLDSKTDETIVIYSNDGDMAFIALQFPEKRMLTMIDINFLPKPDQKKCLEEYIYFDNNQFHDIFVEDLFYEKPIEDRGNTKEEEEEATTIDSEIITTTIVNTTTPLFTGPHIPPLPAQVQSQTQVEIIDNYTKDRLLLDFLCVSFFGGNDFVKPIPFGKIRINGSYQMYLKTYKNARKRHRNEYLVEPNGDINKRFLSDILYLLARQEARRMNSYQQDIVKQANEPPEWGPFETWQDEWSQYQHTAYSMSGHPEHTTVRDKLLEYKYLDQSKPEVWKAQYYKTNFGLDPSNVQVYNMERSKICRAYLKSIIFTLKYYLTGKPPSWRWNYQYHVAPWPSDILIALRSTDLQKLGIFYEGEPYHPLEQLLLTVPITSSVFPIEYRVFQNWLPSTDTIILDRLNGDKYIYTEPVLKSVNEPKLLEEARKIKLGDVNAKRNRLNSEEFVFITKKTKPSKKTTTTIKSLF